jgi:hypothetical protein
MFILLPAAQPTNNIPVCYLFIYLFFKFSNILHNIFDIFITIFKYTADKKKQEQTSGNTNEDLQEGIYISIKKINC